MKAEIIGVGTEILNGRIINTNAAYIADKLSGLGIDLTFHTTVDDNPAKLVSLLEKALSRSDLVFTTGGLGPTVDDITLYAIGSALSRPLVFKENIKKDIETYFKKRSLKAIPEDTMRQAHIPKGARWFRNKVGTAPGIATEYGKKLVISLPGPPRELIPIFEKGLIPYLKRKGFAGNCWKKTRRILIVGLIEAEVNRIIKDLFSSGPNIILGIYAHPGEVELVLTSKGNTEKAALLAIAKIEKKIRQRLGNYIYGQDHDTLESVVGRLLTRKKKTIATAESCTGGLISNKITDISGSSRYFKMGVITYSNKSKVKMLGVSEKTLKKYGAVSKEVAIEMAGGVRKLANSNIGLAVTGIAGPSGGTKKKPVGLVFIAACGARKKLVRRHKFAGTRGEIKHRTSIAALDLVRVICGPLLP